MHAGDLAAVSEISDAVHGRYTEPAAIYAERLDLHPAGCRVLVQDGAVTGYLISHPWHRDPPPALGAVIGAIPADADTYYLHDIALLDSARGTGAGGAALALVVEQARALGLGDVTLMAVGGADRFWSSRGFAYVASDAGSTYGPDCHLMRLALPG
ncbi:GNAT family N-acetyltransferase [Sphingomonas sp. LM7]|uniref:GNAT family N-acetyltransferase n=1 Tax=Sphingomonas sp. LM7 TaxID=1938607 RepID=UPI000983BEFF|nr:GNAT family N-acetyltransferase [Sphingomonas sp. LM7]AQR75052.1 GNAT family N-acetyltransferase [Sphingomonas sp. LM7]